jgi:hypothetical protein
MELADRIKTLLGQGLPGTVVASAVGCDPSYVSQLMDQEEFRNDVLVAKATKAEAGVSRDNKWDQVEDMALDKAVAMLPLVSRPSDLIRIAQMANAAKRRTTEFANGSESASPTVNLILPPSANIVFQMNAQAQVVEVDGRSMTPLPTQHLAKMIAQRRLDNEAAGVVEVAVPKQLATERKKVETILEAIGFSDEPVPVPSVMR